MEPFVALLVLCVIIYFVILFIRIPIIIAQNRGVSGGDLAVVSILSWLGILFGLTWIVALVLSLLYDGTAQKNSAGIDVDELGKLYDLKKKGAITPAEYEQYKKKILKK